MSGKLLGDIAYARSGDKGPNTNVVVIFKDKESYDWGVKNITEKVVKNYFGDIVKGNQTIIGRFK